MPTYSTRCEGCGVTHDIRLSFSDYDAVKLGVKTLECTSCQGRVVLDFAPGEVSFILRDGVSGGWASKANRENQYRARHRQVMAKRERDHVAPHPLVPNFAGDLTGTWKEAQSTAYSTAYEETRDSAAAKAASSTYDALVKQEGVK